MADLLDDFDFDPPTPPSRRAPPYPLDEWFDGRIWRIWEGEDFEGDRVVMRRRLYRYAGDAGKHVVTRFVVDGERRGIVFSAEQTRTLRP